MVEEPQEEPGGLLARWRTAWAAASWELRFRVKVFAWLTVLSAVTTIALGGVFVLIADRHKTQVNTNERICISVNAVIDYLRVFNTSTPAQLRDEQVAIDKTLTKPKDAEVRRILDELIGAELANVSLDNLHPFSLPDLSCHGEHPTDDPGD